MSIVSLPERHDMWYLTFFRDWILLVCFPWRYEATEDPRVNFVMRFNPYIYILTTFSKLYRFGNEISGFFLIQNTRSLFYGRHYSSLHRLMSLHGKIECQHFSYVYRSRKHWECKYMKIKYPYSKQQSPTPFNSNSHTSDFCTKLWTKPWEGVKFKRWK